VRTTEGQNMYSRERQEEIVSRYTGTVNWMRANRMLSTPAFEHALETALQRACAEAPSIAKERCP
jgi:hypothetical protein